jgi:CRP/FNR family transcriptional regulator, cyclic AMP receptor protein
MKERDSDLFRKMGRLYPAGMVLFREGEPGSEMYVIHEGTVRLTRGKGNLEKVLADLPAGEFFGEMAIVINRPRTATATILEDSRLLVLDATTFEAMVRKNAEIALRIIKKLAHRLEAANTQIDILLRKEPNHRVVFALRTQAEQNGRPEGPGIKVDWSLDTLVEKVGMPRLEVEEVLERLGRARLVTAVEDGFIIPQVGRLQEYLEFLEIREKFGGE